MFRWLKGIFRVEVLLGGILASLLILIFFFAFGIQGWLITRFAEFRSEEIQANQVSTTSPLPSVISTPPPVATVKPTATHTPIPTPTPSYYRADPYGPVKIDAGSAYLVSLGYQPKGTKFKVVAHVRFNSGLSGFTGSPDIDLGIGDYDSVTNNIAVVGFWPKVKDGFLFAWETPYEGNFGIRLDNSYSKLTAKQVTLEYLKP